MRRGNKENKGSRSGRPVEEASPLNVELPLRLHYLGALINLRLKQTESIVADSETQRVSGRYNCSLCRCQAPGGMQLQEGGFNSFRRAITNCCVWAGDHLSVIDLDPGTRRVTGHRSLSLSQCDMVRPLIIDVLQCSLFTREGHRRGTVGRIWQHLVVKLHDLGEHF